MKSLKTVKTPSTNTRHDVIYNNIFGNSNPNKSSAYPKYGKIKNFVYDISIQDVHPNINIVNYPMYNATANNDYDSYPTPEEYKRMMDKVGQKNYAYAGGDFIRGVPMRSQMPVYNNLNENKINYKNLTTLNDSNLVNNNMNNFRISNYSNRNMETNASDLNSGSSTGYYKTEAKYTPSQREQYNLTRVPEAIN